MPDLTTDVILVLLPKIMKDSQQSYNSRTGSKNEREWQAHFSEMFRDTPYSVTKVTASSKQSQIKTNLEIPSPQFRDPIMFCPDCDLVVYRICDYRIMLVGHCRSNMREAGKPLCVKHLMNNYNSTSHIPHILLTNDVDNRTAENAIYTKHNPKRLRIERATAAGFDGVYVINSCVCESPRIDSVSGQMDVSIIRSHTRIYDEIVNPLLNNGKISFDELRNSLILEAAELQTFLIRQVMPNIPIDPKDDVTEAW